MNESEARFVDRSGVERDKRELRAEYRATRRAISDPAVRADKIWRYLVETSQYRAARSVLLFDSIPGEPPTAAWKDAARRDGKIVWVPEDSDLPASIDLVVVPGVAFTATGHRLGQGGGWYDRYLAGVSPSTSTIGVCFAAQLVAALPIEAHDRPVHQVICERGIVTKNVAVPDA